MAANLVRDVSISRVLGVSAVSDAVFLALSLPVFVVMVVAIGFRSASLPFVERVKQTYGMADAAACVAHLLLLAFLGFAGLALLIGVSAPFAARWFPGVSFDAAATARVLVMCLPMFVVSAVAMMLEGPLQASGLFLAPALLKSLMPMGFACGLFLGVHSDSITYGLVGGSLGAVAQCLLTAAAAHRAGLSAPVHLHLKHAELPPLRVQFGYLLLAGSITYLNPLINQWMSTPLGTGAVSTLAYASRLSTGVSTLAISSTTPALLAQFSRLAAAGDRLNLTISYKKACLLMIGIGGAGVLGTWLLARPVVELLYQGKSLGPAQTDAIVQFLCISIVQLVPLALGTCAAAMLSATSQNRVFAPVGIILVSVNVLANLLFIHWFGLTGMALSTIVMYCCSLTVMNVYLVRQRIIVWRAG